MKDKRELVMKFLTDKEHSSLLLPYDHKLTVVLLVFMSWLQAQGVITTRAPDVCPRARNGKHEWKKALQSYEICSLCNQRR